MQTGEGVKTSQNFVDVLYEWSLARRQAGPAGPAAAAADAGGRLIDQHVAVPVPLPVNVVSFCNLHKEPMQP